MIDPMLNRLGSRLADRGFHADHLTLTGFIIGLLCIPATASHLYLLTLALLVANRLIDGLDGAIARHTTQTDHGAFLDITLDFIFYSAFVFGFCLARAEDAVYGAFLIFTFVANGSVFLAYSTFAEKNPAITGKDKNKSMSYLTGLAEGTETIIVFVLMCLFPTFFAPLALLFGCLCLISATARIITGYSSIRGGQ